VLRWVRLAATLSVRGGGQVPAMRALGRLGVQGWAEAGLVTGWPGDQPEQGRCQREPHARS